MKVETRLLSEIRPYERNPRDNEAAIDAVAESIRKFGFRQPIVVDEAGVIIAGHSRWRAAAKLGLKQVPVHVATDLTPEQARSYRIADNKTAELADWNIDLLSSEVLGLEGSGLDWTTLGFDEDELAKLLGSGIEAGLTDPDEVPEPPLDPVSKPGDVWLLGNHRLLCGDSSNRDAVEMLLAGKLVQLVNMDPPYNVAVEPRSNNAVAAGNSSFEAVGKKTTKRLRAKDRPIQNDSCATEAEFEAMLQSWFNNAARVLEAGRGFYFWGGYSNFEMYPACIKKAGLYFSQCIIWDKLSPVMSRKDFMGAYEVCFYGWKEGGPHVFLGEKNITDLWKVKKLPHQKMEHLTAKPSDLAVRAMQYSSRPGENVLDLFGGSGFTLIAAEQTGRNAFLMEIDPLYCDVIVDRYQRFSGKQAKLEKTGESPVPMRARDENMR